MRGKFELLRQKWDAARFPFKVATVLPVLTILVGCLSVIQASWYHADETTRKVDGKVSIWTISEKESVDGLTMGETIRQSVRAKLMNIGRPDVYLTRIVLLDESDLSMELLEVSDGDEPHLGSARTGGRLGYPIRSGEGWLGEEVDLDEDVIEIRPGHYRCYAEDALGDRYDLELEIINAARASSTSTFHIEAGPDLLAGALAR